MDAVCRNPADDPPGGPSGHPAEDEEAASSGSRQQARAAGRARSPGGRDPHRMQHAEQRVRRFGWPEGITEQSDGCTTCGSARSSRRWSSASFVWGLIFWCVVRYRKRGDELPVQTPFNLPIEILYTVVPFLIIAVLFYYTAVVQTEVQKRSDDPDVTVEVVAFKWNWQFNYPDSAGRGRRAGRHARHQRRHPGAGAADRPDDPVRGASRRHPLVLGAGAAVQAGRLPGQRNGRDNVFEVTVRRGGRLRRPLRRAVRHLPLDHELRAARGLRREYDAFLEARESGKTTAEALEAIGQPGERHDDHAVRDRGATPPAGLRWLS